MSLEHNDKIEWVAVTKLKAHPKNRNKHSSNQIDEIVKQLKYQGWRHAIVVSNQSGFIAAGHGRLLAAKKMGLKKVPVVYQDFTDAEQEYAFGVADNAIARRAELDLPAINFDVQELGPDFDISLLGIENFVVDFAEKGFDPGAEDEPKSKQKMCPHCGEAI
jgi:ParB-like chromosome segregation protein Spo0J